MIGAEGWLTVQNTKMQYWWGHSLARAENNEEMEPHPLFLRLGILADSTPRDPSHTSSETMSLPKREFRWERHDGLGGEALITPNAIHSPPYTYGPSEDWESHDELRMDDIAWVTPDRLADRIKSGDLAPDQNPPSKKWLLTQLHLYGIPHKKTGRVDDLKAALVKAWKDGQVSGSETWRTMNINLVKSPHTNISVLTSRRPLLL